MFPGWLARLFPSSACRSCEKPRRFERKPNVADRFVSKPCSVQISGALSKTILT
ncbi:hypothetical protein [Azospirillum palustre]